MTRGEWAWIAVILILAVLLGVAVPRWTRGPGDDAHARAQNQRVGLYAAAAFAIMLVQVVLVVGSVSADGFTPPKDLSRQDVIANYGFAILIGLLVGATELISRYRDEPFAPLISTPGAFYILINGGAAALAYYLLALVPLHITEPLRTLTAGVAAMTFFRSALFNVRMAGVGDVPVGPNLVLLIILKALDRAYDRARAAPRSELVRDIVGSLSFAQVRNALPLLCFDLMQNLSADETTAITKQVTDLSQNATMNDQSRMMSLGLALLNLVGVKTLRAAVDTLGSGAKAFNPIDPKLLSAIGALPPARVLTALPAVCDALADPEDGDEVRRRLAEEDLRRQLAEATDLSEDSKVVLTIYGLVRIHGDQLVAAAISILRGSDGGAPTPAPRSGGGPGGQPQNGPAAVA